MARIQVLLACILLFADGIMARNVLQPYKPPEAKHRKNDIPFPGYDTKIKATGYQKIHEYHLRYNPTYTDHPTFGTCLRGNATCRALGHCNFKKSKSGYPKTQTLRSKKDCQSCEERKKTCYRESKHYKHRNIRDCQIKQFYCRRRCGQNFQCRGRCRSIVARCMREIRNPVGYIQMLR